MRSPYEPISAGGFGEAEGELTSCSSAFAHLLRSDVMKVQKVNHEPFIEAISGLLVETET